MDCQIRLKNATQFCPETLIQEAFFKPVLKQTLLLSSYDLLFSSFIGEDDSGMIQLLSAISQPQRVLKPEDMQITRLYSLSLFSSVSTEAQFSHPCTKADVKSDRIYKCHHQLTFFQIFTSLV